MIDKNKTKQTNKQTNKQQERTIYLFFVAVVLDWHRLRIGMAITQQQQKVIEYLYS